MSLADRWLPQLAGTQIPRERAKWYAEEFKDHKAFDRDFSTPQVKDKRNMVRDEWETTRDATYVFSMSLHDVTPSVLLYIITFALRKSNQSFN